MDVKSVLDLIKRDDIEPAFERSKVLLKNGKGADAFLILRELQAFCHRQNQNCPLKVNSAALYAATRLCCDTLSTEFKVVDEVKFSTYMYYVLSVLSQCDLKYCDDLMKYFLLVKESKKIKEWRTEVSSTFSHILISSVKNLEKDFSQDGFNLWFSFASKIYQLDGLQPLSRLISGVNSCLLKINDLRFLEHVLTRLSDSLERIKVKSRADKDVPTFLAFVQNSFAQIFRLKGGISQLGALRSCFDHFKMQTGKMVDLEVFSAFLFYTSSSESAVAESWLLKISNSLSGPISCETLVRMTKILFKFGLQLPRHKDLDVKELTILLKIVIELYERLSGRGSESLTVSDLTSLIHYGLTVFHVKDRVADDVINAHELLMSIFEHSISLKVDSRGLAEILVESIGRTLLAYKTHQLDPQMSAMSLLALKVLCKFDSAWLIDSKHLKWWAGRIAGFVATSNAKSGTLENALVALVAFSGLHPRLAQETFSSWAEAKTVAECGNIEIITVHDVIETHKQVLESEWPPFKSDEIDVGLMLLFELQAYLKKRVTRNKPVTGVYKLAAKYHKDNLAIIPILTATIDALTTENGVAELGNLETSLLNVINHLRNLLKKETKNEKISQFKCLMGNAYYAKLRFEVTRLRKSMESQILANKNDEIPVLQIGNDAEDRESSKVSPEFDYLILSKQEAILSLMKKTVNHWLEAEKWMTSDVLLKSTLGFMKGVAFMYRLQCFSEREAEVWKLLFRVAVKQESPKYQVLAVAELLSVSKTVAAEFLERAEAICENQESGVSQHNYVYQLFYVNYAKHLILNGETETGKSHLSKIELLKGRKTLINVQVALVKYLIDGFRRDSYFYITENFGNVLYIVKHNRWDTFNELSVIQWLLTELTYVLGSNLCDSKLVRYSRSYVMTTLALAKQLVLPLRTCRLLQVLGSLDALCCDVNECEIKLSGMGTILELEALFKRVDADDSCELANKSVCNPQFIHHGGNCGCVLCTNVECQCRSLDTLCLKIASSLGNDEENVVENLVESGLKLIRIFEERGKEVFTSVEESKTRFYMAVTKLCFFNNDIQKALEYLDLAEKSLSASAPFSWPVYFNLRDIRSSIDFLNYKRKDHRPKRGKKTGAIEGSTTPERKPPPASVNAPVDPRVEFVNEPPVTPRIALPRRKILAAVGPSDNLRLEPVETVKTPNARSELATTTPISYPGDATLTSAFKTPLVKKSTRKGASEKKLDLFKTPVLNKFGTKPKVCIQIFCDDDDSAVAGPSSKAEPREKSQPTPKNTRSTLKVPAVTYGDKKRRQRRLARVFSSSDSEDETASKALNDGSRPALEGDDNDESVIEITPPKSQTKKSETRRVEKQFEQLSLSSDRTLRCRKKL